MPSSTPQTLFPPISGAPRLVGLSSLDPPSAEACHRRPIGGSVCKGRNTVFEGACPSARTRSRARPGTSPLWRPQPSQDNNASVVPWMAFGLIHDASRAATRASSQTHPRLLVPGHGGSYPHPPHHVPGPQVEGESRVPPFAANSAPRSPQSRAHHALPGSVRPLAMVPLGTTARPASAQPYRTGQARSTRSAPRPPPMLLGLALPRGAEAQFGRPVF